MEYQEWGDFIKLNYRISNTHIVYKILRPSDLSYISSYCFNILDVIFIYVLILDSIAK